MPKENECLADETQLFPEAQAHSPDAAAPAPRAKDDFPEAVALGPIAVAYIALVTASYPNADDRSPFAFDK